MENGEESDQRPDGPGEGANELVSEESAKPMERKVSQKIVIPFVLPWESQPCRQNQHGMSAFGCSRNAVTKTINSGGEPLEHHADPFLSMFAKTNNHASQKGMHSFGAHRFNVTTSVRTGDVQHQLAKVTETIIPKQSGAKVNEQNRRLAPLGAFRRNVTAVECGRQVSAPKMDPKSKTFLPISAAPNPNSHAGTSSMDHFRGQVFKTDRGNLSHDRKSESVLPRFYNRTGLVTPDGTGAGISGMAHRRQIVTPVKDIYPTLEEDVARSKKVVPWATSPSLQSQQGTGGFQRRRDVASVRS